MPVLSITQTFTDTLTFITTPTTAPSYVTSTTTISYPITIPATPGETLTILAPSPVPVSTPTGWYMPTVIPTNINTVTELDVFLQSSNGAVWSTTTLDASISPGSADGSSPSQVFVIPAAVSGWGKWPDGAKAGLIIGVVVTMLVLVCCFWGLHRRKRMWYTHEMPEWGGWGPMAYPPAGVVLRGGGIGIGRAPSGVGKKEEEKDGGRKDKVKDCGRNKEAGKKATRETDTDTGGKIESGLKQGEQQNKSSQEKQSKTSNSRKIDGKQPARHLREVIRPAFYDTPRGR